MSIRDLRKLEQQGYTDYTQKDEDFYKRVDPSFEAYKNYGDVLDKKSSLDQAIVQAGGQFEESDTTAADTATVTVLGTLAANYGKWEPYASSLLRKGFPNASFSSQQIPFAEGTFGRSGASTTLGAAASKYYGNLTSGTAAGVGPGIGTALVGYGIKEIFGDDDPTTYTAWRAGKKKQKAAIKAAKEQRQREIAELYAENREDFSAQAEEEEYLKMRSMFDNPYGMEQTSAMAYTPSYAHGGYHFNYQGMGTGQTGGPAPGYGSPSMGSSSMGSIGVEENEITSAPTPFFSNPFAVNYQGFLQGAPMNPSPVINQGQFLAGASQRSALIEGRGDAGDAGGFLQRQQEEQDSFYKTAEKGMKVAEVTGNEVIMPAKRQAKIEKAIAKGDKETPANLMKQTLAEGKVTKGNASHDSNPMPIMSTGAVLDKEGKDTGLKADNGAGIYHQASKQFKPGMSNSEMTKIIKKNIESWKKQGKA